LPVTFCDNPASFSLGPSDILLAQRDGIEIERCEIWHAVAHCQDFPSRVELELGDLACRPSANELGDIVDQAQRINRQPTQVGNTTRDEVFLRKSEVCALSDVQRAVVLELLQSPGQMAGGWSKGLLLIVRTGQGSSAGGEMEHVRKIKNSVQSDATELFNRCLGADVVEHIQKLGAVELNLLVQVDADVIHGGIIGRNESGRDVGRPARFSPTPNRYRSPVRARRRRT
jgi:hypothetical protein